jgi:hypothetical protein
MKKFLIPFMSLFLLSSTPYFVYAQTDLEKAAAIGVGILGALFSSKKSKSSNNSDNSSTTTSYNSASIANSAYTQEDGIKIVTGHPDLKIQIKRCAASGKTVIIDMVITNKSGNDIETMIHETNCNGSSFYDSDGNSYESYGSSEVKVGNKPFSRGARYTFINDIPVKVQLKIPNVATTAELLARVDFMFWCDALGLGCNHKVVIRNIPISRE